MGLLGDWMIGGLIFLLGKIIRCGLFELGISPVY